MTSPAAPVDARTGLSAARFGIYVHFPYCLSKCPYCDFASIVARQVPEVRYTEAILAELGQRLSTWPQIVSREVQAIYFGGGTPSLWDPAHIFRVLGALRDRFAVSPSAEITLEANPGAADIERFSGFRAAGINRLSMGVQSFHPLTLAFLGRSHDAQMAERAFGAARDAGFDNVSLDFIYGVPGQTVKTVTEDASRAARLGPEHLSAYALTLDKESLAEEVPLARQLARGEVRLPDDEVVVAMQRAVRDVYRQTALERYEISNYARPGYHSRHNALYWTGGEYLALGTGATGMVRTSASEGVRYTNHRSAERYLSAVEANERVETQVEGLGPRELFEERVAMGLRLTSGVDLEAVCAEYGEPYEARRRLVDELVRSGLAHLTQGRLALTDEGMDVHSAIAARLM